MIKVSSAEHFVHTLENNSVHLLAIDPPYFDIVPDKWDKQWNSVWEYAVWLTSLLFEFLPKLTPDASVLMWGAIGRHAHRPFWTVLTFLEQGTPYITRDVITLAKKRAYGRDNAYLFVRQELAWLSVSKDQVRFNKPYLPEKRGYKGWNKKYPALSEYKRVSNVWTDVPDVMRPRRRAEKPLEAMKRIVETHSHPGDLVVDCFAGTGVTALACKESDRRFLGCDVDQEAVTEANLRIYGEASEKNG